MFLVVLLFYFFKGAVLILVRFFPVTLVNNYKCESCKVWVHTEKVKFFLHKEKKSDKRFDRGPDFTTFT